MEALTEMAHMIANTPDEQLKEFLLNYDAVFESMHTNNKMINEVKEEYYRQHVTEAELLNMRDETMGYIDSLKEQHKDNEIKVQLLTKIQNASVAILDTLLLEGLEPIIPISFLLVSEHAKLPTYAHEGDAGMDLYAAKEVVVQSKETTIIPTGLKALIPSGYELQIRPRSGMSAKTKIRIANAPGTVDSNYRGEIGIIVDNIGEEEYKIQIGDRIAQMVPAHVPKLATKVIDQKTFDNADATEREGKGFGSSGF